MKKHKQTKMHIENAMNHGVPSFWWFVGGHKPNALPSVEPTHPPFLKPTLQIKNPTTLQPMVISI